MDKSTKKIAGLIAFGVILFVGASNLQGIGRIVSYVGGILAPVMIGAMIAFVLNVPVSGLERGLMKLSQKKDLHWKRKGINLCSILLTFLGIILALILVSTMILPQLVTSVRSIYELVEKQWPVWMKLLEKSNIGDVEIISKLKDLDLKEIAAHFVNGAGNVLTVVAGTMSSAASGFATTMMALVIAVYILMSKQDLSRQSRKLLHAYASESMTRCLIRIAKLTQTTYGKFLSGQCMEAVILGLMIFAGFSVFRLPYAGLIAVLTSFFSFIPYIGAFASCAIGVFLIFLTSPVQAVIAFVVYQCIQFVENQFIYPKVVGNSVGLSPLWTVVALIVGGKLFGLVGMLFFIPFTSVVYTLLKEDTDRRLEERN